jgi:transposase
LSRKEPSRPRGCRQQLTSPRAREAGIRYPVAPARAAWERCVTVPLGAACQDEAGRLWECVWLLRCAIGRSNGGVEVRFGVILRKVWGGSRTWVGARAQAVLMSVWRTCWQQGRSALDCLSQLLRRMPLSLAFPP